MANRNSFDYFVIGFIVGGLIMTLVTGAISTYYLLDVYIT